jgi:nucleoside-diphosphate-sugar epimerase
VEYDWYPTTEDHPLRPTTAYGRNKRAADNLLLAAYYNDGFPVTILKPSTTYGPQMGLLRQVAWDFGWIDRIKQGKPIVVCGDGIALHQFLYVEDAALAFCGVLDKSHCLGKVYNVVRNGTTTWRQHHHTAMKVIGREVPLVGIPFDDLKRNEAQIPGFSICDEIFRHHTYYSSQALQRDVPEFQPAVSLESGMARVLEEHERLGNVPSATAPGWEDELIACQRRGFGLGTEA